MYRKYETIIQNWIDHSNKALLIYGARQVGKTYIIREMLKRNDIPFFEVNLIEQPKICEALSKTDNSKDIADMLALYSDVHLEKQSVIFLDEIQQYPDILTKIKFLVDQGQFRYILSGSNLGVELQGIKSIPVGYVEQFQMYPMDFTEFSMAMSTKIEEWAYLKKCFEDKTPIDEIIHEKMTKLFRYYLVSGGMPSVVKIFIEQHTLLSVFQEQKNILNQYKADFIKYEQDDRKLKIISIFDNIPSQLNKQDRRFIFTYLNKELKFDRYEDSFLWLKDAAVAIPVYIANEPKTPLVISKSTNKFKLFQSDVGLLTSTFSQGNRMSLINNAVEPDFNCGALFENYVAQELASLNIPAYYYKKNNIGEIDFIIESSKGIIPLEVKSGKDFKTHKSLNTLLKSDEFKFDKAFVLCVNNIQVDGKIVYLPIYMTCFLAEKQDTGFFNL